MQLLRAYLNSLSVPEQAAYARRCGTTIGSLRKALSVNQKLEGAVCRLLDMESGGAVPRASLRPDIWPTPNAAGHCPECCPAGQRGGEIKNVS